MDRQTALELVERVAGAPGPPSPRDAYVLVRACEVATLCRAGRRVVGAEDDCDCFCCEVARAAAARGALTAEVRRAAAEAD